uniref:Uncharacterized protein n=1 Tax=Streptomyces sp. NBC_00049 TaxID=2903617 RepID=A0AAU2JTG6_9ACTN
MDSEHPADEDSPESEAETPAGFWKKWLSGSKAWQPLLAALIAAGAAIYGPQLGNNGPPEPPKPSQAEQKPAPLVKSPSTHSELEPIVGLKREKEETLPNGEKKFSYWGTVERLADNRRLGIMVGPIGPVAPEVNPYTLKKEESGQSWGSLSIAEVDRKNETWQLTTVVGMVGSEKVFEPYAVPPGMHEGCTGVSPCPVKFENREEGQQGVAPPSESDDLGGLEPLKFRDLREVQATPTA